MDWRNSWMTKHVEVKYYDAKKGCRACKGYDVPLGFVENQVMYNFKKLVGYAYYKRFVRDVRVEGL